MFSLSTIIPARPFWLGCLCLRLHVFIVSLEANRWASGGISHCLNQQLLSLAASILRAKVNDDGRNWLALHFLHGEVTEEQRQGSPCADIGSKKHANKEE